MDGIAVQRGLPLECLINCKSRYKHGLFGANVGAGSALLFGNLNNGVGNYGLSYANVNNGLTNANWNIASRSSVKTAIIPLSYAPDISTLRRKSAATPRGW